MSKPSNRLLLFFCLLKLAVHFFLIHPDYDLHRDEYLHLDQARHLAAGYISLPPLTALLALLIKPFGSPEWMVHLLPAIAGMLTIIVVWKTVEALGGKTVACVLAATGLLCSMLLRINMLFQPNSVDVLLWTALYYCLIRLVQTKRNRWLYYAAVCFALGWLNKYNIVFWAIGVVPALLLTTQRRWLWQRHTAGALLVALLLMLPNLLWQYQNNFPVVWHMKTLSRTQLVNVSTQQFLLEQVLLMLGAFYLIVIGWIALLRYRRFQPFRFIAYSFVFTLLLFVVLHAKGYYALGLYPILVAFGAVRTEAALQHFRWRNPAAVGLALVSVGLLVPPFLAVFPVTPPEQAAAHGERFKKFGLLRWEDGKEHQLSQDFADMLGWRELAQKTDAVYERLPDKAGVLVLCNNYGQAGAINYYSRHKAINAVSYNADYLNWFGPLDSLHTIIRVMEVDEAPVQPHQQQLFASVTAADSVTHPLARERGTRIWLLAGADSSVSRLIASEARERKAWLRTTRP
jgi:hypothetical protein